MLKIERVATKFKVYKNEQDLHDERLRSMKRSIQSELLEPLEDAAGDDVFYSLKAKNGFDIYLAEEKVMTFTFGDSAISYSFERQMEDVYVLIPTADGSCTYFHLFNDEEEQSLLFKNKDEVLEFLLDEIESSMYL